MIEQAFYTILSTSTAITALVASRIYPIVISENSHLPAIDYSFVGGSASPTLTTTGTQKYRLEVNCWGSTYADAVTLRNAVIGTLNGYLSPTMSIQFLMPRDLFDDTLLQYRAIAEFYIYFTP